MITRLTVSQKLQAYLNNELSLAQLVDWAETAVIDAQFEEEYDKLIFDIVARIGVADVDGFKLSWQEITEILEKLGYRVNVALETA